MKRLRNLLYSTADTNSGMSQGSSVSFLVAQLKEPHKRFPQKKSSKKRGR